MALVRPRAIARSVLTACAVLALPACFSGPVPDDVELVCASTADCPADLECAKEVERCVPPDVLGKPAPALDGEAVVAPALVRADVPVRATFTVDQKLRGLPRVELEGTSFTLPILEDESDAGERTYVAEETVGGSAPPEGTHAVVATVTSLVGRSATLRLGTVTVDRTPNRLDGAAWVSGAVGAGASVSLDLRVIEPVDDAHEPRVFLVDADGEELAPWQRASGDGTQFSFSYTLPDPAPFADGRYGVRAVLLDNAGNESLPLPVGNLEVDTTPPSLADSAVSFAHDPLGGAALVGVLALSAAGPGAEVTLSFSSTENLRDAPAVEVTCSAAAAFAVDRIANESSPRFFTYQFSVGAGTPQGACAARAALVDAGGNTADVELATFDIDTSAPAPLVDVAGAGATLLRAPWGAADLDADGMDDRGALVMVDAAAEAGLFGVALEPSTGAPFAHAELSPSAQTVLSLGALDRDRVDVVAVDAAGNVSAPASVRRGVWVATLGDKVPGSTTQNPHRALALRALPVSAEGDGRELGPEIAGTDAERADARTALAFTRANQSPPTTFLRAAAAAAWDDERGELIAFGGAGVGSPTNDTFVFDGRSWVAVAGGTRPPHRSGAAMAYDARRAAMVMFGGADAGGEPLDDTWERDGAWREVAVAGPPPRTNALMAYDPLRDEVVMFGGRGEGGALRNDTWVFDGTSWTERVAPGPGARERGAMAFDPSRGAIVMYGGLRDTQDHALWTWDGTGWTSATPSGLALQLNTTIVHEHRFVFDPDRGALVLIGMNTLQEFESEMVVLNGTSWAAAGASAPSARSAFFVAFDPLRRALLVAGGGFNGTTEVLSTGATAWVTPPANAPGVRSRLLGVYDPRTSHVLFAAGRNQSGLRQRDTWSFDGVTLRLVDAASLPNIDDAATATRSTDAYAFGGVVDGTGYVNTLRRFNGTAWTTVTTAGTPPTARSESAMAVEETTGDLIVFGGVNASGVRGETYRVSGTTWSTAVVATAPSARCSTAMTWDRTRNAIVLFGGDSNPADGTLAPLGDTWLFANGVWTDLTGSLASAPSARAQHSMTTDPVTGRALLFGGSDAATAVATDDPFVWELGPGGWTPLELDADVAGDLPPPVTRAAFVADPVRQQVVLFGGNGQSDAYRLDRAAGGSPAVTVAFDLTPLTSADVTLTAVEARAVAGGAGAHVDLGAVTGATVMAWQRGAWTPVATTTADASAPSFVASGALSPSDVATDDKRVRVAVVSAGQNGAGGGTDAIATVDHLELRVAYERSTP